MFSRERCSRFSQKESSYKCENCAYGTKKKSNFLRHLTSLRHGYLRLDKGENTVDKEQSVCTGKDADVLDIDSDIGLQDDAHSDLQQDAFGDDADHYFNDDDEPEQEQDNNIFYGECADAEAGGVESNSETEWFPFISKLHFLLSILYSSKTHRVSDEVMTFFLFILKECGTQNVPSLCKVKGCLQEKFDIGEMIQKHEDMNGNISWTIKPSAMLQLQLANPETAKRISRYPTVESSSQTIHQASGDKWRSMEFHWAINRGGQQFLKGQFISFSLRGQTIYGKIMQFLENLLEDRIYVKVSLYLDNTHTALTDEHVENNCFVKMNKYHTVLLDDCIIFDASSIRSFKENSNGELIYLSNVEKEETLQCSSLWRDLPVVNVPINLFIDDLSANQSRRWAPLHAVQGQISGLPLEEKNKGKSVMFLGLAEKVTMLDLLSPICSDIEHCKKFGIETYDAGLKQKVVMTTDISLIVTDYQMMSLACNHLGPSANKFCPKCFADDSDPFNKWELRTKETTLRTMARMKLHTDRTAIQRQTGIKEYDNCLWKYLDTHKDTPIGILHFLYLGLAKQLIKFCLDILNEHQKKILEIHLDSIDQSGFSYRINKSFFKYIDSRQGKDYKHYLQIAVLNMDYAGLPKKYISVLEKLAMISKHLIKRQNAANIKQEMAEYLEILKDNIPELGRKRKTHLGVHLADDIERHGHPLQYAEDCFEKNHKAVRSSIAHQNGHARSRDTAIQFINNELMAHVIAGGFMPDSDNWRCASENVMTYKKSRKILNFLGMNINEDGDRESIPRLKNMVHKSIGSDDLMRYELQILQSIITCGGDPSLLGSNKIKVKEFKSCSTKQRETAKVDSFALYRLEEDDTDNIGQIEKLIQIGWKGENHQVVFLRRAKLIPSKQITTFQELQLESRIDVVKCKNIIQNVHCVHDCKGGKCILKEGPLPTRIEQEVQNVACKFIKHSSIHNVFIVNKCRISHATDKFLLQ